MKKQAWSIDDDDDLREALGMMLRLLGYETREFKNARSAGMTLMEGEQPDIICLDINMPEVSGLEFLKVVRNRRSWRGIPILIVSSESDEAQVEEAIRFGADGYVFKPVNLEELQMAIKSAINRRELSLN